jgi:AraC-like DNA-binding protein
MESCGERVAATRGHLQAIPTPRRPRLLLVDADLGRRASLTVALATRYTVHARASAKEALARAASTGFDVAILDATVFGAGLPATTRALRARSPGVRLIVIAARQDLRARHHGVTLAADAVLFRPVPAAALLDRTDALVAVGDRRPPFDRRVGRAIDLVARDVTHLLDVDVLAEATGVPRPRLAERFTAEIGLDLHEYTMRIRLAVAEQLLRDTDLDVSTLADLLGFTDAAELARVFSARAGRAPDAYRLGWRPLLHR